MNTILLVLQKHLVLNLSSLKFDDPKQITTRYLDIVSNTGISQWKVKKIMSEAVKNAYWCYARCVILIGATYHCNKTVDYKLKYHKWSYRINMDGKSEEK